MYSDRNFEIRPEYQDPTEAHLRRIGGFDGDTFQVIGILLWIAIVVGIFVVIGSGVRFLHPQPQQSQTPRSQHEYFQEQRRSPARPGGGERSSSPPVGRSTQTRGAQEEAPQTEVVVEEKGASAPIFFNRRDCLEHHWSCFKSGDGRIVCRTTVNGQFVFRELVDGKVLDCQLKEQGE